MSLYDLHKDHELAHLAEGVEGLIYTLVNRHNIPVDLIMKNLTIIKPFFLVGDCTLGDLTYDPKTKRIRMRNFYWKKGHRAIPIRRP